MKKSLLASIVIVLFGMLISITGCKKDEAEKPAPIIFNSSITYGSMSDQEGNTYKTVTIGSQTWMAENLKTSKYNDGTLIPMVTDDNEWVNLITHAYCWFRNDSATYKNIYGALYNWYSVNTGKLAPAGWHIPSDAEWTTLTTFLGGEDIAGGKMKETGMDHWSSPNTSATNSSGFTGFPAGDRGSWGIFYPQNYNAHYWSSSQVDVTESWIRGLNFDAEYVYRTTMVKYEGMSVRCIKDE